MVGPRLQGQGLQPWAEVSLQSRGVEQVDRILAQTREPEPLQSSSIHPSFHASRSGSVPAVCQVLLQAVGDVAPGTSWQCCGLGKPGGGRWLRMGNKIYQMGIRAPRKILCQGSLRIKF